MVYAFLEKQHISTKALAIISISCLALVLLLQPITDGQDFLKYYNLVSGRSDVQNAINFYSYEVLFWVPQYFLATQVSAEVWRDLNVVLLFIFPVLFLRAWLPGGIHRLVVYYVVVWSLPGSYLLYGNALRQHLMVLFLITTFALIRRWPLFLPLSALIHKSAILHAPLLMALLRPKFALMLGLALSGLTMFLGKYIVEEDTVDLAVLASYCFFFLALSIVLKDKLVLILLSIMLIYGYSSPLILERLILSSGPILGYYLAVHRKVSNLFLFYMSGLMVVVNVALTLYPPDSILTLYRSVLP